jgi:hypothetical protein
LNDEYGLNLTCLSLFLLGINNRQTSEICNNNNNNNSNKKINKKINKKTGNVKNYSQKKRKQNIMKNINYCGCLMIFTRKIN